MCSGWFGSRFIPVTGWVIGIVLCGLSAAHGFDEGSVSGTGHGVDPFGCAVREPEDNGSRPSSPLTMLAVYSCEAPQPPKGVKT